MSSALSALNVTSRASAAHAGARACGDPRRGGGKLYLIGMVEDVDSELLVHFVRHERIKMPLRSFLNVKNPMTEVAREDLLRELTETHNVISKLARELRSPYSHKSATPRCHHPPCAPSPLGRLAPLEAGMARSRPGSFADSRARGTSEAGAGRLSYGSPRPQRVP